VSRGTKTSSSGQLFAWDELSLEIAQLDPIQPSGLAKSLVQTLARHFTTDRVSLVYFDSENGSPGTIISTQVPSGTVCDSPENSQLVRVRQNRQRMLIHEARSEQQSGRGKAYRTDGCALFPLIQASECFAVLCVSNISLQQIHELESAPAGLERMLQQVKQLSLVIASLRVHSHAHGLETGELSLLRGIVERLDGALDSRSMFTGFLDLLADSLPIDCLGIIYAHPDETARGVICLQRASHRPALERTFAELSDQWQRRNRHTQPVVFSDVTVFGDELLSADSGEPPDLDLGPTTTVPIFMDSDLFALALVAAGNAITDDRRRMELLSFLLHQLMLHVKKNCLMDIKANLQTVDSLTGLHNERYFQQLLEREFDRAERYNLPLSLHIFDVDHFKDVNEAYGYETGDLLLKEISRILMENIRTTDIVSRANGERFFLLLPETHGKNGEILANRLRRYIENFSFYMPNTNVFIKVTVSVGAASFLDHRPSAATQFTEFADTALYFAKRHGRNQVVGYGFVMNMMLADSGHNG
jgi:diguanylate cyclase (GGDEF)-like protein